MRGNKILEKLTVQDSNTPHSCDYRYNHFEFLESEALSVDPLTINRDAIFKKIKMLLFSNFDDIIE
jgi:hypothetical protein